MPNAGPIVPTTPAPIDPCKNQDPCILQISDIVKSSDTTGKAAAAASVATLAAVTPAPVLIKTFVNCENGEANFSLETVLVPANSMLYVQKIFEKIANIEAQQCRELTAVATVPEWWQVRFEGGISQLILSYQELKPDGTIGKDWYPITIPHPKSTAQTTTKLTPDYEKGNWQILLTLKDNSKVIINSKTEQGGIDFMNQQIKPLIDPSFLTAAKIKTSHYPDQGFKQIKVTHKHTDYYATGQRSLTPTWRKAVK